MADAPWESSEESEETKKEDQFLENLKKSIEDRLEEDSLSIKDIVLGRAKQQVEIIPDELTVTYRSPRAGELTKVREMATGKNPESGKPELNVQKHTYFHLSLYILRINEMAFSPPTEGGSFSKENVQKNADMLMELDDNLIVYLLWNRGWFLDRVRDKMTDAMLGNG